jgi:hypothetical protein
VTKPQRVHSNFESADGGVGFILSFTEEFATIRAGSVRWFAMRRVKTGNWESPKTRIY